MKQMSKMQIAFAKAAVLAKPSKLTVILVRTSLQERQK